MFKIKGQVSIEVLIILSVLIIGAVIFGTYYINNLNSNLKESKTDAIDSLVDNFGNNEAPVVTPITQVTNPTASPASGTALTSSETITLSSATSGASIYYTKNGSNPIGTTSATEFLYSTPITAFAGTVKAIAIKSGMTNSSVVTFTYTIAAPNTVVAPVASPDGNTYNAPQLITLTSGTSGAEIRYTLDGNEPTESSALYNGAISISTTKTLKAKAYRTGWTASSTMVEDYVIVTGTVATPIFYVTSYDPCTIYTTSLYVSISTTTPGASIYYTTNGTEPTESSNKYGGYITLENTSTLKAKAYMTGWTPSGVASKSYRIEKSWDYCSTLLKNGIYELKDPNDLNCMKLDLDGDFSLDKDIDLSGVNFEPIGRVSCQFMGSFDGRNHIIENLYMDNSSGFSGLFGQIYYANIQNIGLVNVNITGKDYAGSLVGVNDYSEISNSYSTGTVVGNGFCVGGLVGKSSYSTITNTHFIGNVSGQSSTGGLSGLNEHGVISNSYSTGSVSGLLGTSFNVGGLIGNNSDGEISSSYSTAIVVGQGYQVGGLVGSNIGPITSSYSTGSVSGNEEVGGLVGYLYDGTISISHSTSNVSGTRNVGGLVGWMSDSKNSGQIDRSYSTGNVFGTEQVGGFIGSLIKGDIQNNYSFGTVTRKSGSTSTNFGGFLGTSDSGVVTNSYSIGRVIYEGTINPINKGFSGTAVNSTSGANFWNTTTSLQSTSPNGALGLNDSEMKNQSMFESGEWDFSTIWRINTNNSGYPFLQENPPE